MSGIAPDISLQQASIHSDINSLDRIRQQGLTDELGAIKQAAKEFESFFMNMMLKSMRQASEVIGADNPFSSQQEKMYTSMLDEQLSVNLSQGGHLKIADLMVQQLTRQYGKVDGSFGIEHHLKNIETNKAGESQPALNSKTQTLQPENSASKVEFDASTLMAAAPSGLAAETLARTTISKIKAEEQNSVLTAVTSHNENINSQQVLVNKPQKKALFEQGKDFIAALMPYAEGAARQIGVDPKLLVAQAALETGWGKFVMHDAQGKPGFNFFGIKAGQQWQGDKIAIDTLEVEKVSVKKVNAEFRAYENIGESFKDYVTFIKNQPRYQDAVANAKDPESYVKNLQSAGYATDPEYAAKILRIYQDKMLQPQEASGGGK